MKKNVGTFDRALRIVAGLVLVYLAGTNWRVGLAGFGGHRHRRVQLLWRVCAHWRQHVSHENT